MKAFYLTVAMLLSIPFLHAQETVICKDFDQLIEFEKEHHQKIIDFRVNPLTQNYDLKYHRLEWEVDPDEHYIKGTITSYFIPTQANFTQINFDLRNNMTVNNVIYNGQALNHTLNSDDNLSIDFNATLPMGVLDSISVEYEGVPETTGFGSFRTATHDFVPVLWTLSEPYGAKTWWPCKQDLTDKIDSIDIIVTTPEAYRVGTNGLLISETSVGNDQIEYHWRHRYPIPAYLISLAVTNYAVFEDYVTAPDGSSILILNYVYPERLDEAVVELESTIEQMELFNELFGLYPFADEKYGHAQFNFGGGMEHQTMSSMGGFSYGLQAHELAHQWFGDKVTCGSWQDIWLNEGFATYLTALTSEFLGSDPNAFYDWKVSTTDFVTSEVDGSTFVYDTTDASRVFNSRLTYRKGALILNSLRWVVGDNHFFDGVKSYVNDPNLAYGYARTDDLQYHLENTSGIDLDEFFEDWLYGEGYPSYHFEFTPSTNAISITVDQETSHNSVDFFEMPVPVRITNGVNDTLLVLDHTFSGQTFEMDLDFTPTLLFFDPDKWIISRNNTVVSTTSDVKDLKQLEAALVVLPNPASDYIEIVLSEMISPEHISEVEIYNQEGALIQRIPFNRQKESLDISNWPSASYYLNFLTPNGTSFTKEILKI
ncbi:MAG: hypothetical protein MI974_06130 [Chitinophagales bacterium]|nr:hypothetical protein [Chitinophagales bacterium]